MGDRTPVRTWAPGLAVALLVLLPGPSRARAQAVSESQVKAAYLYNFAKFVEWPAQVFTNPTAALQICVLRDPSFESELNRIVKDKAIAGHPVSIVPIQDATRVRSCQILFINSTQNAQARHILDLLRDASVLTVGETKGFAEQGGIINFVLKDDSIRFQVNHRAASQAGLQISSRLLSVATLVIE